MAEPIDVERLVQQLTAGASPEESRALLEGLMSGHVSSILEKLRGVENPTLGPVPSDVRGLRVRLDLHGARPPVWRRLELPGDLTLPRLHDVIQASMGWYDSHLHRFRTARDPRAPYFVTNFDLDEGEEGVLEDDVRLDQLLAAEGDELWYEYDFGDGWDHRLLVETVLDEAPSTVRCTAGRGACPPEDCGGLGGYERLAAWVRGGYEGALLPDVFESSAQARAWLPSGWHPDHFDLEATDAALALVVAEPVAVTAELAELAGQLEHQGIRELRGVLARPLAHGPVDVSDADAGDVTETYRALLENLGDGVSLTAAGYLPPSVVERFADRSGISRWWIGKANREDTTRPVADVRAALRALGLISVRKGYLAPTSAAVRCREDPQALRKHIIARLPLGTSDSDRQAGWMALAVVASGAPAEAWHREISDLLFALGWCSGPSDDVPPSAHSPTLRVLEHLAGSPAARWGKVRGDHPAVAATARAVIRRG